MRILIVDDETDVTRLVGEALRGRGHDIVTASTGYEAIEVATWFQPDAALVDVGLPDIDGITLAELIRGTIRTRVRIVAFSGYSEARLRPAVRRDVFDDYLLKPATVDAIERALRFADIPAHP